LLHARFFEKAANARAWAYRATVPVVYHSARRRYCLQAELNSRSNSNEASPSESCGLSIECTATLQISVAGPAENGGQTTSQVKDITRHRSKDHMQQIHQFHQLPFTSSRFLKIDSRVTCVRPRRLKCILHSIAATVDDSTNKLSSYDHSPNRTRHRFFRKPRPLVADALP
jgi:hypothetical protein